MLIEKPWGTERIVYKGENLVVKILNVDADKQLSLQKHEEKTETLFVDCGAVTIQVEGEKTRSAGPGDMVHLPNGTVHRIGASYWGDAVLVEVSTLELDDVVRLEDDYGRCDDARAVVEQ